MPEIPGSCAGTTCNEAILAKSRGLVTTLAEIISPVITRLGTTTPTSTIVEPCCATPEPERNSAAIQASENEFRRLAARPRHAAILTPTHENQIFCRASYH